MQPTYLPWAGYFQLMNEADIFIFYDDVQFARRSWQQRNRILLHGQESFLTVPVLSKGLRSQLINEVRLDDSQPWRHNHTEKLKHAYKKHSFGSEIIKLVDSILLDPSIENLADLNICLINSICSRMQIGTRLMKSSDIPVEGKKSQYLLRLCEYVGATEYISPAGAMTYIEDEGLFASSSIKVIYQDYTPAPYAQRGMEHYSPYLSIVDVIANIGFEGGRLYVSGGHTA
ncbi:WbqC family protein [Paenibacillus thiaminolyticus]|uniref:WbqC family protein n=1 Tax=Paenibacillus thiaminolyticus TaxID=49283 RepID=UPI00232D9694|nr:WbqC family protein [Paenibacillus thiaminolyticus]WCF07927.1 WbqC family protein [Paenibacillus thiaminolyticus]